MTTEKTNNLEVYFRHIDHAVKVAGIDHVAIGSDRDHRVIPTTEEEIKQLIKEEGANFIPDDWPLYLEKLNGPRRMEIIWDGLIKRGYKAADAEKVMGLNLYRLYRDVIG
jgi:membrane dipeptidase